MFSNLMILFPFTASVYMSSGRWMQHFAQRNNKVSYDVQFQWEAGQSLGIYLNISLFI